MNRTIKDATVKTLSLRRSQSDYWQFPTVSMGLGPLMAIYQARFLKYLHARGFADTAARNVWAFLGDGEMDEPESTGAISLAAREKHGEEQLGCSTIANNAAREPRSLLSRFETPPVNAAKVDRAITRIARRKLLDPIAAVVVRGLSLFARQSWSGDGRRSPNTTPHVLSSLACYGAAQIAI